MEDRRMSKENRKARAAAQAAPLNIAPGGGAAETPYPTFAVTSADKWRYDWDEKTRQLVLDRLHNVPARTFFSPAEFATLEALCARALPQDDRPPTERIPIAPWIDARLQQGRDAGYRYEDMPDDQEAYRRGLAGVDQTARALFGADFIALRPSWQDRVLRWVA